MIPFFFIVETIKPEFLQSVHMGQISQREAGDLQAGMESKRKWSLAVLGVCVMIFALVALFTYRNRFVDVEEAVLMIAGIGVSVITAIFQINKFFIARTYLRALKHSRPGSVTNEHPLYNLDKIDQQLLDKISARKFSDAEARGLLNIANAARSGNKQALMLAAALVAIAAFVLYGPMELMPFFGESMAFFPMFVLVGAGLGFLMRFSRLRKNAQYISALQAKYPLLNKARW